MVGFLGPNGAGKTTTIRMLLNILLPSSGLLKIFGTTFDKNRVDILKNMNASSGTLTLPGKLSTFENLNVFAAMYGLKQPQKRIRDLISKFDLEEFENRPVFSLSTGQQVRVSLAKAFLNKPRLLLLDEPTSSLDPDVADRVRTFLIRAVKEEETTVFLTSHNMSEVEKVCTRVLFLNEGKIQAEGSPKELARQIKRWKVFLKIKHERQLLGVNFEFKDGIFTVNKDEIQAELDRNDVGAFLTHLVRKGVEIENISIHEPTLEDFFVHSARQTSGS
jgi:ABC-2 type transport system ATP-binding protein